MSKLLIIAGQSNALTRGVTGNLPVKWQTTNQVQFYKNGEFSPYHPEKEDYWGAEVGWVIEWVANKDRHEGENVYIVKCAKGNTQLAPQNKYGVLGAKGFDWWPNTPNSLFQALSNSLSGAFMAVPKGDKFTSATMLWVHGEADSRTEQASRDYVDNCRYFFAKTRMLIPVPTKIGVSVVSPRYSEVHRNRQRYLGQALNTFCIDGVRTYQDDGIHLSRNGTTCVGRDAYRTEYN